MTEIPTLTADEVARITAAPIIAATDQMTRADWLNQRRHGLGGSDAAAIIGLAKWSDAYTLWQDKTGRRDPDDGSTLAQRRGHHAEPFILQESMAAEPGLEVFRAPFMLQHPDNGILFADVDALATHTARRTWGGGEAKNVHPFTVHNWADGVPGYYEAQVLHYMAVTGLTWWVVMADCGGDDLRVYFVDRDEETIEALVAAEVAWWERHVIGDEPPAVDGSKSATEALALIEARAGAVKVLDPSEAAELADTYRQLAHDQAVAEQAEEAINLTKNRLRQLLGDCTELEGPDGQLWATWRQAKDRQETDWAAVAAAAAEQLGVPVDELAADHTITKPGNRSLRTAPGLKHITASQEHEAA